VHWREAWKYGERAFRYCQLDIGHALGALRYAAAALGWTATVVNGIADTALAGLMGLDRADDFSGVEREDADLLIAVDPHPAADSGATNDIPDAFETRIGQWAGRANLLDPHPFYRWPVIDQVSRATHGHNTGARSDIIDYPPLRQASEARAADIILGRRSAQRFDSKFTMSADVFYLLLDGLLARPVAPWDVWSFVPRLHPILFVHRVEGLEPGFYPDFTN
jgi:nitroreductase